MSTYLNADIGAVQWSLIFLQVAEVVALVRHIACPMEIWREKDYIDL